MKDKVGNEITVGCYLAWAVRSGSCYSELHIGKVLSVGVTKEWDGDKPYISVLAITPDGWLGPLVAKKTKLTIPNRAIVLHESSLPEVYKVILGEK